MLPSHSAAVLTCWVAVPAANECGNLRRVQNLISRCEFDPRVKICTVCALQNQQEVVKVSWRILFLFGFYNAFVKTARMNTARALFTGV